MKEILKYLRQTHSFTQEEIAHRLEISRQSYSKYENGTVEPNDRIIRALSLIYGVREEFILENKVPLPEKRDEPLYPYEKEKLLEVADPAAAYRHSSLPDGRRIFEGYFDGTAVRILDVLDGLNIRKGQRFKLYLENEEEEKQEGKKAFETLMSFKGTLPADFDYKEALYEALVEKYGPVD